MLLQHITLCCSKLAPHYSVYNYVNICGSVLLQWARSVSPIKLVEESDPLYTWRARVFEQFHQDLTETIGYQVWVRTAIPLLRATLCHAVQLETDEIAKLFETCKSAQKHMNVHAECLYAHVFTDWAARIMHKLEWWLCWFWCMIARLAEMARDLIC